MYTIDPILANYTDENILYRIRVQHWHKTQVNETIRHCYSIPGEGHANQSQWAFGTDEIGEYIQLQAINCLICGKYRQTTQSSSFQLYVINHGIDLFGQEYNWKQFTPKCILCNC
jgi:hypothetical protein